LEERNVILARTRYLLSVNPPEDAEWYRDEPVMSLSEGTENRGIPTSSEVHDETANREFTTRFNDLARAMREFSKTYNAGK
jgi:hypothetical protein